jgi:PhnB protein
MTQSHEWKPKQYSSVSPYLVAAGAQKVIDFAKATFGATPLRRYENADGTIMHAEFRIDDTVVMIADANEKYPATSSLLHVYVPDVTETFARALQAGGVQLEAPTRREGDPDERGMVKDPCGNAWSISTQR